MELVRKTVAVDLHWLKWLFAALPMGLLLLALVPLLAYWLEKPTVTSGTNFRPRCSIVPCLSGLGAAPDSGSA